MTGPCERTEEAGSARAGKRRAGGWSARLIEAPISADESGTTFRSGQEGGNATCGPRMR
jgi:hypothetical protein